MIKKGDKVRFLNSVGGGIVRGFHNKHVALVEDESGFEFPVPVSECVVVDEGGGTARNSRSTGEERSSAVQPIKLTRSEERRVGKECRSRWSPYH